MAMTGRQIMEAARTLLQDEDSVRWPLKELATWITEGMHSIVLAKPSARSQTLKLDLVEGTKQTIPRLGLPVPINEPQPDPEHPHTLRLLGVYRNLPRDGVTGSYRAIRPTDRSMLDAQMPDWHTTRAQEVRQYIFDEENPYEYFVYPGNDGTGAIEALVSVLPMPLEPTGPGFDLADWDVDLDLSEIYRGPLVDYVCYRAQIKDDLAANAGRSAAHYQQFATAIGLKIQVEGATSPNRDRA